MLTPYKKMVTNVGYCMKKALNIAKEYLSRIEFVLFILSTFTFPLLLFFHDLHGWPLAVMYVIYLGFISAFVNVCINQERAGAFVGESVGVGVTAFIVWAIFSMVIFPLNLLVGIIVATVSLFISFRLEHLNEKISLIAVPAIFFGITGAYWWHEMPAQLEWFWGGDWRIPPLFTALYWGAIVIAAIVSYWSKRKRRK